MQTFLPSTSFEQSAKWLDNQRLGKQRVEVLQILNALTNPAYGWQNHPAVKMWRGWEAKLIQYGLCICQEWTNRGYKDTCYNKIESVTLSDSQWLSYYVTRNIPHWLTEEFASNHRAVLLGKAVEALRASQFNFGQATWDNADHRKIDKISLKTAKRKLEKAKKLLSWYQSFGWSEQPAQRVDGKWPYLWPESERVK